MDSWSSHFPTERRETRSRDGAGARVSTDGDRTILERVRVVTPERVLPRGRVVLEGDRIVAVEGDVGDGPAELLLLPGLIDLHGDDVERHLFPRSGARVDLDVALSSCDRANAAAGVTTKLHAIAFEEAPDDDRSLDLAADVVEALADESGIVDNRVHARCEVSNPDAVDAVEAVLGRDGVELVSLMRHVPGEGQFEDREAFLRRYAEDRSSSAGEVERLAARRDVPAAAIARRAGRLARAAADAGVVVASHDDDSPEAVDRAAACGVDVSEYPTTMAAARRAADRGLTTALGAPNLVRGGSLWGNLDVEDAIQAGVVDVLCSDYHPPSLLAAPFVDTGEPLPDRVRRVTAAPADAVCLDDRGRVVEGARADLAIVDPEPVPTVRRAFVAGREVYRAGPPSS